MCIFTKAMGELVIERKRQHKSVDDYADGVMDMYNFIVRMLNEKKIKLIGKGDEK